MTLMWNIEKDASGQPIAGKRVTISLLSGEQPAYSDNQLSIESVGEILTDENGRWELDLEPNVDLVPAGTVYSALLRFRGGNYTHLFIAPDAPGLNWIGDNLSEIPGDLPSGALGGHLADTTAHLASSVVVSPVGGLVATEAQAALAELDSEISQEVVDRISAISTETAERISVDSDLQVQIDGKEPSIPNGTYGETPDGEPAVALVTEGPAQTVTKTVTFDVAPVVPFDGAPTALDIALAALERHYDTIDVVRDHGADRTGTTSAVAAFDAAITAANISAAPGVNILLPPFSTFDLEAGTSVPVTHNNVRFMSQWSAVTKLLGENGTMFRYGTGATGVFPLGGGLSNVEISYTAPHADSRVIDIDRASRFKAENLVLDNVRQLARLYTSVNTPGASNITFHHIRGTTDSAAGSVVIDARAGVALFLRDINVYAKDVGFPTDATTPHPANDTIFLRFGQGTWDTVVAQSVVTNRYNKGLLIEPASAGVVCSNMYFMGCIFDYCKTNGIHINVTTGAVNSVFFVGGWAVATDGHSVQVAHTSGLVRHIKFTNVVGRQAGKNNWRFSGTLHKVELVACTGLGANRLAATNTGSDQDDLVILASGVKVAGGSYGEDGQPYTAFVNQGRYGINVSPDLAELGITGVSSTGATSGYSLATDTTASFRRLVHGNFESTAARPSYASTSSPAAPTSAALQTWTRSTVAALYIYGGTVTAVSHNGVQVSDGSGPSTLALRTGDTWSVTYSVAPTIRQVIAP